MSPTLRPPIYGFRPFNSSRVSEIRQLREASWIKAQFVAVKPPRKSTSTKPRKPAQLLLIPALAGLSPEAQAAIRLALGQL